MSAMLFVRRFVRGMAFAGVVAIALLLYDPPWLARSILVFAYIALSYGFGVLLFNVEPR